MLQIIKLKLIPFSVVIVASMFALMGVVSAQDARPQQALCKGANDLKISTGTPGGNECKDDGGKNIEGSVNDLVTQIINIFSVIVGIIAVIMIIIGGLKFITSTGDAGRITSAKQTIIYAVIGLIIVALAQFFVRFVLSKTSDVGS